MEKPWLELFLYCIINRARIMHSNPDTHYVFNGPFSFLTVLECSRLSLLLRAMHALHFAGCCGSTRVAVYTLQYTLLHVAGCCCNARVAVHAAALCWMLRQCTLLHFAGCLWRRICLYHIECHCGLLVVNQTRLDVNVRSSKTSAL